MTSSPHPPPSLASLLSMFVFVVVVVFCCFLLYVIANVIKIVCCCIFVLCILVLCTVSLSSRFLRRLPSYVFNSGALAKRVVCKLQTFRNLTKWSIGFGDIALPLQHLTFGLLCHKEPHFIASPAFRSFSTLILSFCFIRFSEFILLSLEFDIASLIL